MYSTKDVGPRMDPWKNPAITGYSCKYVLSSITRGHLILGKDEIRPNISPKI